MSRVTVRLSRRAAVALVVVATVLALLAGPVPVVLPDAVASGNVPLLVIGCICIALGVPTLLTVVWFGTGGGVR